MTLYKLTAHVGRSNIDYLLLKNNSQLEISICQEENGEPLCRSGAFNLSNDEKELVELLDLLHQHQVFPISLDGILEDLGYTI